MYNIIMVQSVMYSVFFIHMILSVPQEAQMSRDSPHWPNSSEEDISKDEAANLPSPNVEEGVWKLSAHDIECLALGAGILGCGGGGDPNQGKLLGLRKLEEGKEITVINPCRFVSTVHVNLCTVYDNQQH